MLQAAVAVPEVVVHLLGAGIQPGQIAAVLRDRKGQAARWRGVPQQHIRQGVASLLARIPEQQQASHLLIPGLRDHHPSPHQRHHGVGIGCGHGVDQGDLIGGKLQVGAITTGEVAAGGG